MHGYYLFIVTTKVRVDGGHEGVGKEEEGGRMGGSERGREVGWRGGREEGRESHREQEGGQVRGREERDTRVQRRRGFEEPQC